MNREERRKSMKVIKNTKEVLQPKDPNGLVRRQEVFDIISQLGDNMDEIQKNLVDNVNTLYSFHLFPAQMEIAALEKLLIEKGIITQEEIDAKVQEHKQSILDKAKQIKENKDGEVELASEEEAKESESKAVLKALSEEG